jgi:hypothetical protein
MIKIKVSPKMAKYLKDHPYMEPNGLQEEVDPFADTGVAATQILPTKPAKRQTNKKTQDVSTPLIRKRARSKKEKEYFGDIEEIDCIKKLRKNFENVTPEQFYKCMKKAGYDRNRMQEELRSGSFRAVLDIPNSNDLILKVVSPRTEYFQHAIEMNKEESQGKFQTASELAPKVYDSADDFFWTIVEKVNPIKTWEEVINDWFPEIKDIFRQHLDLSARSTDVISDLFQLAIYPKGTTKDPQEVRQILEILLYEKYGFDSEEAMAIVDGDKGTTREPLIEKEAQKIIDKVSNIALIVQIRKLLDEFDLPFWDTRPHNVGWVNRNGKRQFVLLDPGFGLDPDQKGLLKPLNEEEPFQKAVKKKHRKMKIRLIGKGGNTYKVKGMTKPSYKRSKSAPPGFGGSLEENK